MTKEELVKQIKTQLDEDFTPPLHPYQCSIDSCVRFLESLPSDIPLPEYDVCNQEPYLIWSHSRIKWLSGVNYMLTYQGKVKTYPYEHHIPDDLLNILRKMKVGKSVQKDSGASLEKSANLKKV